MRSTEQEQDQDIVKELQDIRREEKISFKNVFEKVFMADLPQNLQDFKEWFKLVPEETVEVKEMFKRNFDPSLKTNYCNDLALWGLSAHSVGIAGQYIGWLLSRLKRHGVLNPDSIFVDLKSFSFSPRITIEDKYDLQKMAVSEIVSVNHEILLKFNRFNSWTLSYSYSEVPIIHLLGVIAANLLGVRQTNWVLRKDVAAKLLEWCFAISVYKPFVFHGRETRIQDSFTLQFCALSHDDYEKRRDFEVRWVSR